MALSVLHEPQTPLASEAANESLGHAERRRSLQEFLAVNYDVLKRKLMRHLGCVDVASECLHDAWLRLGRVDIAPVQSPEAYIYRVACNVAMDRMRSSRSWEYVADAELEDLVDGAPGPDVIAQARSDLAALELAFLRLPRRHQSILVALRLDEKTRQEVAEQHGMSLRTVDTALRQALDYCAGSSCHTGQAGIGVAR